MNKIKVTEIWVICYIPGTLCYAPCSSSFAIFCYEVMAFWGKEIALSGELNWVLKLDFLENCWWKWGSTWSYLFNPKYKTKSEARFWSADLEAPGSAPRCHLSLNITLSLNEDWVGQMVKFCGGTVVPLRCSTTWAW